MKNRYKTYINLEAAIQLFNEYLNTANKINGYQGKDIGYTLENVEVSKIIKLTLPDYYQEEFNIWLSDRDMHTDSEPEKEEW